MSRSHRQDRVLSLYTRVSARLIAALAGAVIIAGCTDPVKPPEKPALSDDGRVIARQCVSVLSGLRTAYDVRQVVDTFDFAQKPSVDSLSLNVNFWLPGQSDSVAGIGLGKRTATLASPLAPVVGGMAKTLATGETPREMVVNPYAALLAGAAGDSLRALDPDTIRTEVDSTGAGPWAAMVDSVFGIWVRAEAAWTARVDSIRRYRTGDSASAHVTDVEQWRRVRGDTLSLFRKQQVHVVGADTVYRHTAVCTPAPLIQEVIFVRGEPLREFTVTRNDRSLGWWNSMDSSTLLNYVQRFSWLDGSSEVLTFRGYAFSAPPTDSLPISVVRLSSDPNPDTLRLDYSEKFESDGTVSALRSYTRTDAFAGGRHARYIVKGDFDTLEQCTLLVLTSPNVDDRPPTRFGALDSTLFTFLLTGPNNWQDVKYTSFSRRDYYPLSSAVSVTDWQYTPESPTPIGSFSRRGNGPTVATAIYPSSYWTTKRQWSVNHLGTRDSLEYIWFGTGGDTTRTRTIIDLASGVRTYRVFNSSTLLRSGRAVPSGLGRIALEDTLRLSDVNARIVSGQIDASGNGAVTVSGSRNYLLSLGTGSIGVICQDGDSCLTADTIVWRDTAGTWVATFASAELSRTFTYSLRLNQDGVIEGSFVGTSNDGSVMNCGAGDIVVRPSLRGSCSLYGIFDNVSANIFDEPEAVTARLSIQLWGSSALESAGSNGIDLLYRF